MANYVKYIKKFWNFSPKTVFRDAIEKKDPNLFLPNGSQIYYGYQGEGKTLSMYYHFTKLKERYPNALVGNAQNIIAVIFVAVSVSFIMAWFDENKKAAWLEGRLERSRNILRNRR